MDQNQAGQASFFDGRLKLLHSKCLHLERDVLVVPCVQNILNGGELYQEVMSKVGDQVKDSLAPFVLYDPGTCKITFSGDLKNYKRLAMCVLPHYNPEVGLSFVDRLKVALAIADALDLSVEMAAETIVFSHWNIASDENAAEILILCIAKWLRSSPYKDKASEILIALEDEHIFDIYRSITGLIEDDPNLILDVLQHEHENDLEEVHEKPDLMEYHLDLSDVNQCISDHTMNTVQVQRDKKATTPFLFYSRNLSTSILSIEQPSGSLRQYRLSTTIVEKNTHYFRCSRCDFYNKTRNDIGIFRPKITIKDGEVSSDRFPTHHPLCEEIPKTTFVQQQLDRMWKALISIETDELRHAYQTLRQIAQTDADALYKEMDTPIGRFPEWEVLKVESVKLSNQFSLRLIKCSNRPVPGLGADTYSAIREVEGELDGKTNNSRDVAWLTETNDESPEEQPIIKREFEEPEPSPPVQQSVHILKRRQTYRIRNINETGPQYKFRLVRPRADESTSNNASTSFQSPPSKRSRL